MKLTATLMCIALMEVSASVYSQNTTLVLDLQQVSVEQVLNEISTQSEFNFVYRSDLIEDLPKVDISVSEVRIEQILDQILVPHGFTYEIYDNTVVLSKNNSVESTAESAPSEIRVSGNVTDGKTAEPLPGVNVLVKGTNNGTVTDVAGNYTLSVPDENDTLVFSSIGFTTQEVPLNGRTVLDIALAEDVQSLEEIVVTGYGTQLKTDVVSSIATVSPEEATVVPTTDLGEMLRGKAAGVQVTLGSAAPGSSSNILIRGQRSITGNNSPLIIVDGVPVGDINAVNPADVASIDILKDAAAQAIYGARASNGVILITTKTGTVGKAQISYTGFAGVQQINPNFDVFTPEEYIQLKREANRTVNGGDYVPDETIFSPEEMASMARGEYIDWREEVLRVAPTQNHTISLSAGSEKTKVYTSLNYQSQDGVIPNTNFKRANIRLNLDQTVNDWLSLGINSSIQFSRRNNPDDPIVQDILARIVYSSPLGQIYNDDGSLKLYPNGFQDLTNPLLDIEETSRITDDRNDLFNLYLDISPIKNFNYRINISRRATNQKVEAYSTALSAPGVANGQRGQGNLEDSTTTDWQLENILSYALEAQKSNVNFTLVQSIRDYNQTEFDLNVNNTSNDILGVYGVRTAESYTPTLNYTKRRLLSFVGRVEYNYAGKYYLTGSARSDGSSVFGTDNKWGFFPAVSVGWNIFREPFIVNKSAISNLKLRASYGSVGNEAIDPYGSLSTAQQRDYIFGDGGRTGYSPGTRLPNPELRWETSTTFNAGVDFGFWTNRLTGSVEFYDTRTKDLLINRSLNAVLGYTQIRDNIGEIKNSGIELQTNALLVDKEDFSVNVGLIFSRNRNEILDLYGTGEDDVANNWFIGSPINVYYTQQGIGIWQEGDDIANSWMPDAEPGDIIVEDVDKDGDLDADDQVIISRDPDWRGTFSLGVNYKGIDLSAYVMTVQGITRENRYLNRYAFGGTLRGDRNQIAVDYWLPENPGGDFPRPREGNDPAYVQTIGFQDASYVRLQTLTVGYTLPNGTLGLNKVRFYFTGHNLATLTDFLSYGPELDPRSYPEARTLVGGLQVNF